VRVAPDADLAVHNVPADRLSDVRQALKRAAVAEGCDFPGFGSHSLRRANITWRQEVGGSSIEAMTNALLRSLSKSVPSFVEYFCEEPDIPLPG